MVDGCSSVGSQSDDELVALGKQFDPLHAAYWGAIGLSETGQPGFDLEAAWVKADQAGAELQSILKAISALPAHTEAGRRVKLRAWAHCHNRTGEALEGQFERSAHEALNASVFRDLLREHGITLRARPSVKRNASQPGSRKRGRSQAESHRSSGNIELR